MDNTLESTEDDETKKINMEKMIELLDTKKVYQCTYPKCTAYFDRPYRLAQHILAHNNIRPYLCRVPECGKSYTSKSHLDRHSRNVHMPQENDVLYNCARCFKTFANRQNLKRHMNTVHKMEYSCELCDKQFRKKNQLSTHMFQHTGVKAFSCEACPETFVTLYHKKRHMKYHRTYTCEECQLDFNHWAKYQRHVKTEHHKDQFVCDDCGRSFKQRCHIVRHVKIHTQHSRTYLCPYENCERTYSRNSNLKQHILVKHLNMFHECYICHSQLSTKAKLNYHVQLHYNARSDGRPIRFGGSTGRRPRCDEGTFKTSTALKLAGLSKVPEELPPTIVEVLDESQSTLTRLSQVPEGSKFPAPDQTTKEPEENNSSPNSPSPVNMTVKTEYIEVEVDIPYDI